MTVVPAMATLAAFAPLATFAFGVVVAEGATKDRRHGLNLGRPAEQRKKTATPRRTSAARHTSNTIVIHGRSPE